MTNFRTTLLREDHNLLYTNFTNPDTMMEDKKGGNQNGGKSLQDLKKELQEITSTEAAKVNGGKTFEKDKWNSHCGGIVPQ